MCKFVSAILDNDFSVAEHVIKSAAFVNKVDNVLGSTPLHWACALGRSEFIRKLVQTGANINAVNIHGSTPLHNCVALGAFKAAFWLVGNGANPFIPNHKGLTPLDYSPQHIKQDFIGNKLI